MQPTVFPQDFLCATRSRSKPIREYLLDKAGNPVGIKSLIADFALSVILPGRFAPAQLPSKFFL
jgi:hypothetical protein